jgi:ATP-dependent DNA helicase RecQ
LLKKSGYIAPGARGKYVVPERAGGMRTLDLANYETKKSYDQSKLAMMLQYAESSSCRRRFILNYFGEDYERDLCGACDNCLREAARRAAEPVVTVAAAARRESGFRIADVVMHPKFGQGTVERTEKDLVTVLFPSVGYKTLLASAVCRADAALAVGKTA